jgi:hypothetical protein
MESLRHKFAEDLRGGVESRRAAEHDSKKTLRRLRNDPNVPLSDDSLKEEFLGFVFSLETCFSPFENFFAKVLLYHNRELVPYVESVALIGDQSRRDVKLSQEALTVLDNLVTKGDPK